MHVKTSKKREPARGAKAKALATNSKSKNLHGAEEALSDDVTPPSQEFERQRLIHAAISPHTTSEELAQLARSKDPAIRAAVATSGKATLDVLRLLSHDPDVEVRRALARYAGPEIGKTLLDDPDHVVRGFGVQYASVKQLPALARDPSANIRGWVAYHEVVPLLLLRRLAKDEDPDVRRSVAGARRTSWGLLGMLQKDPDEAVRRIAGEALERGPRLCDCCGSDHITEKRPRASKVAASKRSRRPH